MGVFVNTWTEDRWETFNIKQYIASVVAISFGTVLTQYSVSQWIWNKRPPHRAPVYLVAWIPFWFLSSVLFDYFYYGAIVSTDLPNPYIFYQIAVPLVVLGGVPLNLAFCWIWSWTKAFQPADSSQDPSQETDDIESEGKAISQPTEKVTEAEATEAEATEADATEALVEKDPPKKKKKKVYYISNIKIFLTCIVIIHHSFSCFFDGAMGIPIIFYSFPSGTQALLPGYFMDLNYSYFMNLFFFWSGYFIPKSLDRKGTYVFLIERAKRIGIPFVIYSFFLGTYVLAGSEYLLLSPRDEPFWTLIFDTGPTWFLLQLIIFGVVYTFGCGKGWSPKASCPSFWGFIGIGLLLGIYSGVMGMFFPTSAFVFNVPYFFNYYLSYAVFFFGGALAQRNNWMEDIKSMNRLLIYSFTIFTMLAVFAIDYLVILNEAIEVPFWVQQLFEGLTRKGGFMTVTGSLTVTVFFMDYMDKKFFCTDFFNNAMYTAYVIHYCFPRVVAWKCGILLFEAIGSMEFVEDQVIENAPPPPLYYDSDPNMLIPFCLFTAAVTMVITWPLAYAIRSIPGFSKVL